MRQLQKRDQGPRQRDHRRIRLASVLILRTLRKANYRVPGKMEPWLQGSRICYSRSLARLKLRGLDSLRFTVVSRLISSAIRFPIHLLVLVQAATTVCVAPVGPFVVWRGVGLKTLRFAQLLEPVCDAVAIASLLA